MRLEPTPTRLEIQKRKREEARAAIAPSQLSIGACALDTIAQLDTGSSKCCCKNQELNAIQKRARSKFLSYNLIKKLYELDSPLKSSYGRSLGCTDKVEVVNGVATSRYCKNRFCLVCARIRTAVLLEKYKKSLEEEITDPYFLTLTLPNVKAYELADCIKQMFKTFVKIKEKYKRRFSRKTEDIELKAVVKLECTFNSKRVDFNPHLHVIVNTKHVGKYMRSEWLERYPTASKKAQDLRKADENSKIELFKYSTKLMSQIEDFENGKDKVKPIIVESLDVIFRALHKVRTLRAYGFKLEVDESFGDEDLQAVTHVQKDDGEFDYTPEACDWINKETGEMLAEWQAGERERFFVRHMYSTGQKFLKKWLTMSDITDFIEKYRLLAGFRNHQDYALYMKTDLNVYATFVNESFRDCQKMGFDDDFGRFNDKLGGYFDTKYKIDLCYDEVKPPDLVAKRAQSFKVDNKGAWERHLSRFDEIDKELEELEKEGKLFWEIDVKQQQN
ncbi:MAG: protein rep [Bacteroidota bacterium]